MGTCIWWMSSLKKAVKQNRTSNTVMHRRSWVQAVKKAILGLKYRVAHSTKFWGKRLRRVRVYNRFRDRFCRRKVHEKILKACKRASTLVAYIPVRVSAYLHLHPWELNIWLFSHQGITIFGGTDAVGQFSGFLAFALRCRGFSPPCQFSPQSMFISRLDRSTEGALELKALHGRMV